MKPGNSACVSRGNAAETALRKSLAMGSSAAGSAIHATAAAPSSTAKSRGWAVTKS
jgi:hypothetical protein